MNTRSKVIVGSILLLSGASSILGNLDFINENFVLPVLGAAFLIVYFILGARKKYSNIGFLIPGVVLPALQTLKIAEDNNLGEKAEVVIVFGVLSVCFVAIYLIHSCWFKELKRGQRVWPLIVSVMLLVFGGIVYAIEFLKWKFGVVLLSNVWPGILVIVGAIMLYKAVKGNKQQLSKESKKTN